MNAKEIPYREWPEFLDAFSRRHLGKHVTVRTWPRHGPPVMNATGAPLLGVTDQRPVGDTGDGAGDVIEVSTGEPSGMQFSHEVAAPISLRSAEWNDGYSAKLTVGGADGARTEVTVGPARDVLPAEMVIDDLVLDGERERV